MINSMKTQVLTAYMTTDQHSSASSSAFPTGGPPHDKNKNTTPHLPPLKTDPTMTPAKPLFRCRYLVSDHKDPSYLPGPSLPASTTIRKGSFLHHFTKWLRQLTRKQTRWKPAAGHTLTHTTTAPIPLSQSTSGKPLSLPTNPQCNATNT
jgi:hypothetical protein